MALDADHVIRWHQSIFGTTFPHQAGALRTGPTWFGVRWREGGRLRHPVVEGSDPTRIRTELRAAFEAYNSELASRPSGERDFEVALTVAARLYAELLRIHPFEDGNLRASFPALQAALVSLGAAPVDFEEATTEHDEALGWALQPDASRRTVAPLVDLLARRIERDVPPWWRVP